ncbi:MAG: hypothetical protein Q9217_001956 [Psora testacea]
MNNLAVLKPSYPKVRGLSAFAGGYGPKRAQDMIRPCIRRPWKTSDLGLRRKVQRRPLVTVARTVKAANNGAFSLTKNEKKYEDDNLRRVFDSKPFWQEYNRRANSTAKLPTGLFQNRYLTQPVGFIRFAEEIREQCARLVHEVLQASSTEQYKNIPRKLDLLSDSLCRVLDVADFVRATHPDVHFQRSATQAYAYLWEYMNILNTTPGLKAQLQKALSTPEISSSWDEEEVSVARILLKDFSNSAVDLPEEDRQRFVHLSNNMKNLGSKFLEEMTPATSYFHLQTNEAKGMDPALLQRYTTKHGRVALPIGSDAAYKALGSIDDDNIRQALYLHTKNVPRSQVDTLEQLLETRAEIAQLSGFSSYAEMSLADKMAKTPESVNSFLTALAADNASQVAGEIEKMRARKVQGGKDAPIEPWDLIYYQNCLNTSLRSKSRKPDFLSAFFSLGTVMQGLSRLFDRLYGIRFVPRETSRGETWDPEVRRLDVIHEDEGHVAVLYCDLFARGDKSPNPAHFTLRCSRLISGHQIADESMAGDDGMARAVSPSTGQLYQLPTIALICDFPRPPDHRTPTLLSFRDVQTLFHEMGHAIHSILGRTTLQVVSGTRCPTDFAELPSVLMESFAADQSVLNLFARHWETDTPLPYEIVAEVLDVQKRGQGVHTETQILYSLLDQAYHSFPPSSRDFNSTKTLYNIYDRYSTLREPRGISPQGFFGHLVEYGGTYYSYLFDRAIAGKVWRQVFRGGKDGGGIDRQAGETFKDEVLKWGGGRNAWACVSGVLGDERLKDGGKEAMEEVGRWGVHG